MENSEIKNFHNAYINADEKELDRLWNEVAPKTLIKFFSAEYLPDGKNFSLENISNNTIWLSSPKHFNDPLDCVINIDYHKLEDDMSKQILSFLVGPLHTEEIVHSELYKQFILNNEGQAFSELKQYCAKRRDSVYVSCFTETENLYSLAMWAHYAKNHTGFCAEYAFDNVKDSVAFGCIPVFYTNDYSYKIYTNNINEDVQNILTFAFTKSCDWQSEKEWRIAEIKDDLICDGYAKKFTLPKRIYMGCRVSEKLKSDLKKACEENKIELYQMKLKPGTYSLIATRII